MVRKSATNVAQSPSSNPAPVLPSVSKQPSRSTSGRNCLSERTGTRHRMRPEVRYPSV